MKQPKSDSAHGGADPFRYDGVRVAQSTYKILFTRPRCGQAAHRITCTIPGQWSVRNGDAGRPAPLNSVAFGLACQAYRTSFGLGTELADTTTLSPSMRALAQHHLRSSPATANSPGSPPFATSPPST